MKPTPLTKLPAKIGPIYRILNPFDISHELFWQSWMPFGFLYATVAIVAYGWVMVRRLFPLTEVKRTVAPLNASKNGNKLQPTLNTSTTLRLVRRLGTLGSLCRYAFQCMAPL